MNMAILAAKRRQLLYWKLVLELRARDGLWQGRGPGPVQWGGGEPLRGDLRLPWRQPREAQHEAGGAQRRHAEGGRETHRGTLKTAASQCISARDFPGRHRKVTLTPLHRDWKREERRQAKLITLDSRYRLHNTNTKHRTKGGFHLFLVSICTFFLNYF